MKGFYRIFNNLWFIPLDKLLSFEIHVLFYLEVEVFDIIHIQLVWDILEHFGGHSPRLVQGLNEEEEVFNLFQNVPTSNFFSLSFLVSKQKDHDHMITFAKHPVYERIVREDVKLRQVDCKLRAFQICTFLFHSLVSNDKKRINIKL